MRHGPKDRRGGQGRKPFDASKYNINPKKWTNARERKNIDDALEYMEKLFGDISDITGEIKKKRRGQFRYRGTKTVAAIIPLLNQSHIGNPVPALHGVLPAKNQANNQCKDHDQADHDPFRQIMDSFLNTHTGPDISLKNPIAGFYSRKQSVPSTTNANNELDCLILFQAKTAAFPP